MADPFVAEIRLFPFNFAPKGWAFCRGQLMPISQNTALFSMLGTTYGGDGKSNFALPDLQGKVVLSPGQGPGLSDYVPGQTGGATAVSLLQSEIPQHSHRLQASEEVGDLRVPGADRAIGAAATGNAYATGPAVATSPLSLSSAGGGAPHNNLMPYLTMSYCIALQGVFPPRW